MSDMNEEPYIEVKGEELPSRDDNNGYVNMDYQLNQAHLDEIKQEIESQDITIISDILDLDGLEKEYSNNKGFLQKIQHIKKEFPHFRRVRRDGSCFYRALLYRLLEQVVLYGDMKLHEKLQKTISQSKDDLVKQGYAGAFLEDLQQLFSTKLDLVKSGYFTPDQLHSIFSDKETADSLNMYLRMLTSGYIKANEALFENFADFDLYGGVDGFCCFEVDPIDKDADQIQIIALTSYLNVSIKILYLDANINVVQPTVFCVPEDSEQFDVTLLYRPGHYDILYGF